MRAVVHLPGEGEVIGGASSMTIKATGEDTGGSLYVGEGVWSPVLLGLRRTSTSGSTTCFTPLRAR